MATDSVTEPQWFAIQSKVAGEKIAEASLRRLGLETLLPLRRTKPNGWRARKSPLKALFPGYLFAFFTPATQLRAAAHACGVIRVVSAGERPLPLAVDVIEALRQRMDAAGCVRLDTPSFRPGESVRIIAGPLAGWQGAFDSALSDTERVVILLETLHEGRLIVKPTGWSGSQPRSCGYDRLVSYGRCDAPRWRQLAAIRKRKPVKAANWLCQDVRKILPAHWYLYPANKSSQVDSHSPGLGHRLRDLCWNFTDKKAPNPIYYSRRQLCQLRPPTQASTSKKFPAVSGQLSESRLPSPHL